jgi:GT2 family glycosyltransferase
MNKLVSINILVYNGENFIESCLKSILNQTYPNVEILIIDNASTDNTLSKIKNQRSKVKIIENKENLGFAAGHNLGIRESRGEYVLCLNQDVILDEDFIKHAVETIEKDDKIGSFQGKLLRGYKIIDTTGLLMFKNRRVINRGQGEEDKNQYKAGEIFGVDGAAPLYRRTALEDTKINNEYFDEDFFCYKEDIDLAWRMRLYGWEAFYEPKAIGYHLRSAGERAAKNYLSVARERRKIPEYAKFYSFKNQRLLQIKNELPYLFFRNIFAILIKEIGAWSYVLIFEHYILKVIKNLFRQVPNAFKKRKIIMMNKRINAKEMAKWIC